MSEIVYRISSLLEQILVSVPVGTNLGLYWLFWTLLSGRLLLTRGALVPALSDLGLREAGVRRCVAALSYGRFAIGALLSAWQQVLLSQGRWRAHRYEGYSPLACDLVGFFRPRLVGCASKHYHSQADKALPAVVLGLIGAVGSVGKSRLCLLSRLVRPPQDDTSEQALMRQTLKQAAACLGARQVLVADAGFSLSDVLEQNVARFVLRRDKNFTARRNRLPDYRGHGRPPEYGDIVRPLPRTYKNRWFAATVPDKVCRWKVGRRSVRALIFEDLVEREAKPGAPSFRCVVILDPKYKDPLVLATNLAITAYALWCLYRDRWPIEQVPLAAKQMLGAEQSYVFGVESRLRLPELALLAGNILSYGAAISQPLATGFWDRCARPTCGRLRRTLLRLDFSELPVPEGRIRKKASVTGHLKTGTAAHRRQRGEHLLPRRLARTAFTGN